MTQEYIVTVSGDDTQEELALDDQSAPRLTVVINHYWNKKTETETEDPQPS